MSGLLLPALSIESSSDGLVAPVRDAHVALRRESPDVRVVLCAHRHLHHDPSRSPRVFRLPSTFSRRRHLCVDHTLLSNNRQRRTRDRLTPSLLVINLADMKTIELGDIVQLRGAPQKCGVIDFRWLSAGRVEVLVAFIGQVRKPEWVEPSDIVWIERYAEKVAS